MGLDPLLLKIHRDMGIMVHCFLLGLVLLGRAHPSVILDLEGVWSLMGWIDYVDIADSSSMDISGPITVAAWIKTDSLSGNNKGIVTKGDVVQSFPPNSWFLYQVQDVSGDADSIGFVISDETNNGKIGYLAVDVLVAARWYHLLGVYRGGTSTSDISIYVNGALKPVGVDLASGSFVSMTTNNLPVSIGRIPVSGVYNYFSGIIDEVAIYNQALTAYQIQQLYAQGMIRHQLANK